MSENNKSFSLNFLSIFLSFLVFKLGSKFTLKPGKTPLKRSETEITETFRKVGWSEFFLRHPELTNRKSLYYYTGWKGPNKETTSPIQTQTLAREANLLATSTLNEIHRQPTLSIFLTTLFWNATLQHMRGQRYIQFDKNLGGSLIDKEEYFKLTNREALNYEKTLNYSKELRQIERIVYELRQDLSTLLVSVTQYGQQFKIKKDPATADIWEDMEKLISESVFSEKFSIPKLKLLAKVHKNKTNGLYQTRPIIPNCCLPSYQLSKFLGFFTAKFQKYIPWILEDSTKFREWLALPRADVATFDFSNLYGNEPIQETLVLFDEAMKGFYLNGFFANMNPNDQFTLTLLLQSVCTDTNVAKEFLRKNEAHLLLQQDISLLTFMVYITCKETICYTETGPDEFKILKTTKFLAMGSPPVAPISNITLAWVEYKRFGKELCVRGLRRLIDDIVIDTDLITEAQIKATYPNYLTLNDSGNSHFLDVSFIKTNKGYITWPYVKPYATIPLSIYSFHPPATKKAAAICELKRLQNLCSLDALKQDWTECWRTRYSLAGYDVAKLEREASITKAKRPAETKRIHIELWKGQKTTTASQIRHAVNRTPEFSHVNTTFTRFMTAWSQPSSLQEILHQSHPKPDILAYDTSLATLFKRNRVDWRTGDGGHYTQ